VHAMLPGGGGGGAFSFIILILMQHLIKGYVVVNKEITQNTYFRKQQKSDMYPFFTITIFDVA